MNKIVRALGVSLMAISISVHGAQAKKLYGYTTNAPQKAGKSSGKAAASAAQTAQINKALQSYSLGKYKDSAQGLEYVDSHGGCCDKVHYFLGLDYQNLNQTVLAQMHYQWVASNSKNARLRQYADVATQQLAYYQTHRTYGGQGGPVAASYSFG